MTLTLMWRVDATLPDDVVEATDWLVPRLQLQHHEEPHPGAPQRLHPHHHLHAPLSGLPHCREREREENLVSTSPVVKAVHL